MQLGPGDKLGPYEILAPIGAGGMGEVYRAKDTKLDRDVAVKVLPSALAQDPDRLARFEREAKVLASLNHPNMLFEGKHQFVPSPRGAEYAVTPDGRHFLLLKPPTEEPPRQIQVIVNWFEELKLRVPAGGK